MLTSHGFLRPLRWFVVGAILILVAALAAVVLSVPALRQAFAPQSDTVDSSYRRGSSTPTVETADDPALGENRQQLVIVAFTDMAGDQSRQQAVMLRQALALYTQDLTLIVRDFPDPANAWSETLSRASYCAQQQGKFWIVYDRLAIRPKTENLEQLESLIVDAGVELAPFRTCLESEVARQEMTSDRADGVEAGVTEAPTYFFNGRRVPGPMTEEQLNDILDDVLPAYTPIREPDLQFNVNAA